MSERIFKMQLSGGYQEPDNTVASLQVSLFKDDEWKDFELDTGTPGFLVFVYAVFSCQHMHMRLGCADRGLHLDSASGMIEIATAEDWVITRLYVAFSAVLNAGEADAADVETIIRRMKNCPVSRNLTFAPHSETRLEFRPL